MVRKAVILAGGLATRLRPLTLNTPKALVPVLNRPFLEHMLCLMRRQGIRDIVLALGNLAGPVQAYFADGKSLGLKIEYVLEEYPMGTAGAIKNAAPFLDGTFLVLNGDIFIDIAIEEIMAFHCKNKALVTIAGVSVTNPAEYGLIEADSTGRITRFIEKPQPGEITTDTINAGLYIMEPEVLRWVPPRRSFSVEKQVFPQLLKEGMPLFVYRSQCYWIDIGTPDRYLRLNHDLLTIGLDHYRMTSDDNCILDPRVIADAGIEVTAPVMVGKGAIIGRNTMLNGPTVIGSSCRIGEGCVIDRSVLWQEVQVESEATIEHSVVADHARVGSRSYLKEAVVGDHVNLPSGYRGSPGSRIPSQDT